MKKTALIFTVILSVLMLCSCGEPIIKDISVADVAAQVAATVKDADMNAANEDTIKLNYDIDLSVAESYAAYVEGSGGFADEVALFKAKSEADADTIKAAFENRVSKRKELFATYNPEEAEKLGNAVITKKGCYVLLVVANNASECEDVFINALK